MAWIRVDQSLATHRKTFVAADLLRISTPQMVGHLVCLWAWAIDNAPDGDLSGMPPRLIAQAAQWKGKCERFVEALISAVWLDPGPTIHDWDEYGGATIRARHAAAERMRASRSKHESGTGSATLRERSSHVTDTFSERSALTEQTEQTEQTNRDLTPVVPFSGELPASDQAGASAPGPRRGALPPATPGQVESRRERRPRRGRGGRDTTLTPDEQREAERERYWTGVPTNLRVVAGGDERAPPEEAL